MDPVIRYQEAVAEVDEAARAMFESTAYGYLRLPIQVLAAAGEVELPSVQLPVPESVGDPLVP